MRPADRIWIGAFVGALVYNVFIAKDGDTLSEAWDRYQKRWPRLSPIVIHLLAKHLANELAPWADPIGIAFLLLRSIRGRRRLIVVVESEPA